MKIYSIVEYVNGKGKTLIKMTTSERDEQAFIEKLDARCKRGSCLSYMVTKVG